MTTPETQPLTPEQAEIAAQWAALTPEEAAAAQARLARLGW